ncbi:hypothetical protein HW115_05625 [Verrucomicrobiaceae bacterium N1E253]|uniref:Phosphoglucomutase n=1 Tax=Oceaniferula marina TaxID=2748318 RepID=A0A851GD23_9BACT|nr:hypothetical protein [Oceaniferula marina]NWK55079.1 hypothetical protein [Oceaniferula marina]
MNTPIKVYDARWEVNEFDDAAVRRLFEATLGYASQIGVDTISITRDTRLGCARVMDIGIELAVEAGFQVFTCFDPISTPMSYFASMQLSSQHPNTMGLAITASHNPAQYVGVKFTVPTVQSIGYDCGPLNGLAKVEELYRSEFSLENKPGGSLSVIENPAEQYIRYSMQTAGVQDGSLEGLSLVLDCFNGSAGPELFRALTRAGVKVIPQRLVPNGEFPTGSPNPASQNKMDTAIEVAKSQDAQLVMGIDGDGDRVVFGDQQGIFSAGFVMIPILKALLSRETSNQRIQVLYDPKVNPLALEQWSKLNVEPVLFRNGHSQIKDFMREIDAIAGAEESGHFYNRLDLGDIRVWSENSLLTILLFLDAVKKNPDWIKEVRAMQEQVFTSGEFNYAFETDEIRDRAMAAILSFFEQTGSTMATETPEGIDLGGVVIYNGVEITNSGIKLNENWYSGYIRIATNEKGVVRSYISSANHTLGKDIETELRRILENEFNGIITE